MDKYYVHLKICPMCGHNNFRTITHHKVVVGHWEYFIEKYANGK